MTRTLDIRLIDDREIWISGSADDFTVAAEELRRRSSQRSTAAVTPDRDAVNVWQGARLEIDDQADRLDLSTTEGVLVVRAGRTGSEWFASVLQAFAESDPGATGGHQHVEYFEDHPFLTEGSIPVVLELSASG